MLTVAKGQLTQVQDIDKKCISDIYSDIYMWLASNAHYNNIIVDEGGLHIF